jgi:pyruvate,water dikinase
VATPPDDESQARVLESARAFADEPMARHAQEEAAAESAASALLERLDRMARRAFKALLPTVRAAMAVAEDDDALFFAAQHGVRRALRRFGDDVFFAPLEVVRAGGDWQALAHEARAQVAAQQAAQARVTPPLGFDDGRAILPAPVDAEVLRGHATCGRARGRAVVVNDPAQAPPSLPPDGILVTPAILPSLAYLLSNARALVTAHGGATSHGATLAREYGVPAVLGARGAEKISQGRELYVDGSSGRVYLL